MADAVGARWDHPAKLVHLDRLVHLVNEDNPVLLATLAVLVLVLVQRDQPAQPEILDLVGIQDHQETGVTMRLLDREATLAQLDKEEKRAHPARMPALVPQAETETTGQMVRLASLELPDRVASEEDLAAPDHQVNPAKTLNIARARDAPNWRRRPKPPRPRPKRKPKPKPKPKPKLCDFSHKGTSVCLFIFTSLCLPFLSHRTAL